MRCCSRSPPPSSSAPVLPLAGCSAPPSDASGPPALLDLWTGLDAARDAVDAADGLATSDGDDPCSETFGTYFTDFGARGLACVADRAVPLGQALSRFRGAVYASGPHSLQGGTLRPDLLSDDFGHYNPDFVEWVVENGVIGEDDPAVRALAAPIYRRHLQRLARVYWLTYQDLAADGFPAQTPSGAPEAYASYLASGVVPEAGREEYYPGFTMTAFSERNDAIGERLSGPGRAEYYSALYEANTAVGFWLRRRADGTLGTFHDGLRRLLATYDADWLAGEM